MLKNCPFHNFLSFSKLLFSINSLPNDKNLDLSNFKTFAEDKINVNKKLKI